MKTDNYYEIGSSHLTCDDYATSGIFDKTAFAIVADGCSSSPDSEVGSRILTHIAKEAVRKFQSDFFIYPKDSADFKAFSSRFRQHIITTADMVQKQLSLNELALDSTLLVAVSQGVKSVVFVFGDGTVILRYKDGSVGSYTIDFGNIPYYLSYNLSSERKQIYSNDKDTQIKYRSHNYNEYQTTSYPPNILDGIYDHSCFAFDDTVSTIAVSSDGLLSYQKEQENGVLQDIPLSDVIARVIGYKNYSGEFVKRRMNKVKREFEKEKISHYDDISVATIHHEA